MHILMILLSFIVGLAVGAFCQRHSREAEIIAFIDSLPSRSESLIRHDAGLWKKKILGEVE